MACSYTKPPAISQATWNQVSWSFDTGSNHPVLHGQDVEGNGVESHPISKTITYYFTTRDASSGNLCFPTQAEVNEWAGSMSASGIDMTGGCVEWWGEEAAKFSTNNGHGVHYAEAWEAGVVGTLPSHSAE